MKKLHLALLPFFALFTFGSVANAQTSNLDPLQILDTHVSSGSIAFDVKDAGLVDGDRYFMECVEVGNELWDKNPRQFRDQIQNNPSSTIQMMVGNLKSGFSYSCYVAVAKLNGQYTRHSAQRIIIAKDASSTTCQSPYVMYSGQCVDPIPVCKNPPLNVMPSTCIDKIENGVRIDRYSFSCIPGYEKKNGMCVNTCVSPLVPFQGVCTDPIPACKNFPAHSVSCIDKIVGLERIERYSFQCFPNFERVGNECLPKGSNSKSSGQIASPEDEEVIDEQEISEGQPDLAISVAKAKLVKRTYRNGIVKKQYKIGVTVKNVGDGDADGPIYFLFSNTPTNAPTLVTKGILEAGKSKKTFIYVDTTEKGNTVLFTADPGNTVDESNEDNNTVTRVVGK